MAAHHRLQQPDGDGEVLGGGRETPIAERRRRVDAHVADLIERGARIDHAHADDHDGYFVVMRDPEGNEFFVA